MNWSFHHTTAVMLFWVKFQEILSTKEKKTNRLLASLHGPNYTWAADQAKAHPMDWSSSCWRLKNRIWHFDPPSFPFSIRGDSSISLYNVSFPPPSLTGHSITALAASRRHLRRERVENGIYIGPPLPVARMRLERKQHSNSGLFESTKQNCKT